MFFLKGLFSRSPKPGKPRPITDDTFEQEVLASDIPAVVDFWSARCPPCQVMSGLLDEIGPDYAERVNIFKLNINHNPQTPMQYQIRSIPTLILFKNHRKVDSIAGLIPLNHLRKKLDWLAR